MAERFELLERLGKGAMGAVWKARDVRTGQLVALKLIHAHLADDAGYLARFEREVEVARRIDSPYVVKVLGYGKQDGLPYIAMEYVEGESLRQLLERRKTLPWPEAERLTAQIATGLRAAHEAGVIHRDIKPSNVLITKDGTPKIADFGIARAADLTALTGSSTMLGTPQYMSPDGVASPASDFYALGCVAYELLAGAPPFEGESLQEVLVKHLRDEPDLSRLPAQARELVGGLLAKDAKSRIAAADRVVARAPDSTARTSGEPTFRLAQIISSGAYNRYLPVDVLLSEDGSAVAVGRSDGRISVFAVGESADAIQTFHTAGFRTEVADLRVGLMKLGKVAAAESPDTNRWRGQLSLPRVIAVSGDGSMVAWSSGKGLTVRVATGTSDHLIDPQSHPTSLAWDQTGTTLASITSVGTVRIWKIKR